MLAQDPPAHAQDIAQPSVNLLVAAPDDEAPDGYVMPDLVGMPVVSAQSALAKVGIKSATPNYVDVPVGADRERECASRAASKARLGDGANSRCRSARRSEYDCETDSGKVKRDQGTHRTRRRGPMGLSEDLERVALQERELQLTRMDEQMAWEMGVRLRTMAEERGLAIVIDVRRFGQPLFYTALKGTTPDNVAWVQRKSNVVARFHRSSYGVGLHVKTKNDSLEARGLADQRISPRMADRFRSREGRGDCGQRDRLRTPAARRS